MKILAIALLPLVSSFAPASIVLKSNSALKAADRPDTSELIQDALKASKKFGASSPEARLAWETVEEIDSSSRASKAMSMGVSMEECEVEEEPTQACVDYGEKMEELSKLIKETKPAVSRAKDIALEMKAIKLPEVNVPVGEASPAIAEALKVAKEATEKYGAESSEAKLAWESLEEISSASEISGALGGRLNEECLTEMIGACESLEEVQRVLNLSQSTDRYSG